MVTIARVAVNARTALAFAVRATILFPLLLLPWVGSASAQTMSVGNSQITGTLFDAGTGLPINGATVKLHRNDSESGSTKSDSSGYFKFTGQGPGTYHIEVQAQGYAGGRSADAFLTSGGQTANLRVALRRSSISEPTLREIGRVSASASRISLQTTSTVTQTVSAERLVRENYTRAADALGGLPGVNLRGLDSAIGDDVFVDIRGMKASETTTLLDGHPIGPLGVAGIFGGSQNAYNGYNFSVSPYFALRDVEVTYGAGALSTLWGVSGIGGTVDLQTTNPSAQNSAILQQGVGNQGKLMTFFQGSGSEGRLSYLGSYGVQGTYGAFPYGIRTQSAFLGQDLSDPGIAAVGAQYPVSANYTLRQNLVKLRYDLSPKTSFAATWFLASSYDDKTGNGDNDSTPYDTRLANVLAGLSSLNKFTVNGSAVHTCPSGLVAVNTNSGYACYTPQKYAQVTSGPNGGGSGRFQNLLNQDYHGRLTTSLGKSIITVDGFIDHFNTDTVRSANITSNFIQSFGYLVSDEMLTNANDLALGFNVIKQRLYGNANNASNSTLVPLADLGQGESTIFVRDAWSATKQVSLFANLLLKASSVEPAANYLDPRLTAMYRPTPNDVIRATGAVTRGEPSIYLLSGSPSFTSPGSATYVCTGLTNVASVPGANLTAETSKEVDLSYGHRFSGDSQVQINLYEANVANVLLNGIFPLAQIAGLSANPAFLGNYVDSPSGAPGYASNLARSCPGLTPSPANFGAQSVLNAATERAQGIELSGRYRVNPRLFFDYTYNLQSVVLNGVPNSVLQTPNNWTLVNGGQVVGTPLNKASLGIDVNDGRGLEGRLDGYYFGSNNSLNGPPYTVFNGSLTKTSTKTGTTINFGVQNIFNVNTGLYGKFGDQVFVPENPYGTDKTSIDQFNSGAGPGERFFLPPRSLQFSISQKV